MSTTDTQTAFSSPYFISSASTARKKNTIKFKPPQKQCHNNTSSSAMADRPREHGDFKGWVILRINFRLKCYVRFCANIYGLLNRGMVILQLCRWKFSHKLCNRLYSAEIRFYSQTPKSLFKPPFGGLMGNIYTKDVRTWTRPWMRICPQMRMRPQAF